MKRLYFSASAGPPTGLRTLQDFSVSALADGTVPACVAPSFAGTAARGDRRAFARGRPGPLPEGGGNRAVKGRRGDAPVIARDVKVSLFFAAFRRYFWRAGG